MVLEPLHHSHKHRPLEYVSIISKAPLDRYLIDNAMKLPTESSTQNAEEWGCIWRLIVEPVWGYE